MMRLLLLMLCGLLSLSLGAQDISGKADAPQEVLTVERAVELALRASSALQKEAIDLELDRIAAKSLWARIFPSISASAGVSYAIPLKSDSVKQDPSYTGTLRLSLSLGAGLPLTMRNLSLSYRRGLLDYNSVRRQLVLATEKSFYRLLAAEQSLAVLEDSMRLAVDQLERDRVARQNGYVGELDFMSASLGAETARLDYTRGQAAYAAAFADFLLVLDLDAGRGNLPKLQGSVEAEAFSVDGDELVRTRLAFRPDLAAQRIEVERLKNAHSESFLSAKAPSLSFSLSSGAVYPDGLNDAMSAGITLNIPLDAWIPRSLSDQQVSRAGAEYEKAVLDLRDLEKSARSDIQTRALNLETAWKEVEIAALQVQYARRAYELSEQGYRRGTINFLDFETARGKLTAARQQLLESSLNYKLQILDLCAALDMDEDDLRAMNRTE
ncbi:MAG: TolC family protein [Treponema sp.]|jgi:outer membrane protein TolC|nr:TolC family protein [Treponema sp.]